MCGIIAYSGKENAAERLIFGLKKLEYRGYDSAGIALISDEKFIVRKKVGFVSCLEKSIKEKGIDGCVGIGHTRWATRGKISEQNCHPILSSDKRIAIVHNGIIENYSSLRLELEDDGYVFTTETDSEVIAALLSKYYDKTPLECIKKAIKRLEGSYAVAAMFLGIDKKVYGFCRNSPLVMATTINGSYFASDCIAIENVTDAIYLEGGEIGEISESGTRLFDKDLSRIGKASVKIGSDDTSAELQGYFHYMKKEIFEQPKAIENTMALYDMENFDLSAFGLNKNVLKSVKRIYVSACGSAYHAGLAFKYMAEEIAKTPVEVVIASEMNCGEQIMDSDGLFVAISQSGETADTLAAVKRARESGMKTVGIINVKGSTMTRNVDVILPTNAGREIAVATTKGYSSQCLVLAILAIAIAKAKGEEEKIKSIKGELKTIPDKMRSVLKNEKEIEELSKRYKDKSKFFFIGKNIDHALSLEASLKLKEITCVHSEGYPSGELKHGTISLVDEDAVCFATATRKHTYQKILSNLNETKTRGGKAVMITNLAEEKEKLSDIEVIAIPKTHELLSPMISVIPYQLFAYNLAILQGKDPDRPKNLAKSVTVE